ncbi:6-phosphogluconolactonase, cycloisomerase 2 family [Actinacidiphila yanglinensis]|uniref:6-phosphogluconolactonase, cycloisomerase 2 family n=1 Tax=Actinacidiphila yanglinensis TaxID=310779 RepID=A0A1H6D3F6_9ACTN|nr:hypothetical protein [Actinacidiphila yanglinensis]SEG79830.1 6-phosphogluconolactonase, cycloisomerase 2 family [Actinacidiphila yanglinensis]
MPIVSREPRTRRTTRTTRIAAAGAVAAAAAAILGAAPAATAATATSPHSGGRSAGAPVFVQSDNPTANTVLAYHRAADGTLSPSGAYPTGGKGGILDGSQVDHLASQGSLAYDRGNGLLYAVNAGSNTLTVFTVHGDHLQRLQVIGSGGTFPVSVTFHDNLVYVVNALDGGSLQGFARLGNHLVAVPSWHRALGLDPTATPQFTHTPGQVSFTPDGSRLVITTKAATNSIDVFPVNPLGAPSAHPVVTAVPDAVPFGFTFDRTGSLQVTEAGPNAVAGFDLTRDSRLVQTHVTATGQLATCWVIATGSHLYASNAGSGTLSGYRVDPHGPLTALGTTPTDPGTVDAAASTDGRDLYVQTGATGTVDAFRVGPNGSLTAIGSVAVPGGAGGEGIVAG